MRLDKYLTETGAGTRSEVKRMIAKGRVCVDGAVIRDAAAKIDEHTAEVRLDGAVLRYAAYEYYMLHKPAGVISASKADLRNPDETCVVDLISEKLRGDLFPVGRLDKDTEGLLLITNDGQLAHRLLSPRRHVDKTYYAELSGALTEAAEKRIEAGVDIGDEKPTLPCEIERLSAASCRITIREGRFHQIKRMFETEGLTVTYLKRLRMGELVLDETLEKGAYRLLTEAELSELRSSAGL